MTGHYTDLRSRAIVPLPIEFWWPMGVMKLYEGARLVTQGPYFGGGRAYKTGPFRRPAVIDRIELVSLGLNPLDRVVTRIWRYDPGNVVAAGNTLTIVHPRVVGE
jgi:hypothetical protein